MANSKSDRPLVRNTIIGCVLAILIFHFAWFKQMAINYRSPVFSIVDVLLVAGFGYFGYISYRYADDPNEEWNRKVVVGIAVALCIWAGAWAAYVNEKVL